MKRRFTILTAALALLAFLVIPMGVRGQTRTTVTDHMTHANLASTGSYTNFSNVSLESDAVYAGNSAREYANSQYNIQLRSNNSNSGIVTTSSGGTIKSITITVAHGTNTIDVYGKNTAYSAATDLYNSNNQGTKIGSLSSTGTINVTDSYAYVGLRSKSGAVYLSSIDFVWEESEGSAVATTTSIDASNITNTDVYVSTTAGSLTATVTETESGDAISGATVTWTSSDTNVATINNNGAVTLVEAGTTTITASYAGESGVYAISSATYELTVTNSEPYVQPTTIEIIPNYTFWGKSAQFSGTDFDELEGIKDNVTLNWTRGNGSTYANLSAMRFYKDNDLTFNAPEGYEIISIKLSVTGTYNDLTFDPTGFDNETTTWTGAAETVTMSRPSNASSYATISKFTITLAAIGNAVATATTINVPQDFNTDIYQGTTAGTLTATVSAEGTPISGATVTWESSNTGVATIDANGAVTLVAVGTTTLTASYAGVEDEYRPSEGTYELTVIDSNAPGTQNNPYTVAQAIANTPSSDNVYIQGIVSSFYNTSIVGDGSNYRYYISDDGGTSTQLLVYKGKGLNQATFTNADDLLVGDEVVIYGTLITYQSAPEVASGNYLYSWNRPVAAVEAPTFSPAAGTFTTAQTVTLSCATTGATIYYTLDGTEPTDSSTEYTNAIAVSTTTTIKAIAYVGSEASTVAIATYHINSQDNPYTVAQALAFNEYPANGIYVHGIVSTAPTQNPTSNGELTYYISVDGEAANQLEVYKGKGLNEAEFEAQDDIQVGDIVTIYGNVVIYNGTKEFAQGNFLVSFERPVQQYTLTVTCSENVEIFTFIGTSTDPAVEGPTTQQVTSGTEVGISVSVLEGYILTLTVDDIDVTSQLDETGYYTFSMPAHDVTVSATAVEVTPPTPFEPATYTLATSIVSGKTYIIVGQGDGKYYAMGQQKSNNRDAVQISVDGTTATVLNEAVYEFTISSLADAGFYSIYEERTPGYLYAASSSANHLKTETDLDVNGKWAISFDNEGNVSVVATYSTNRKVMQFNSTSSNKLFSCYASASQHPVFLYVKDETTPDYYTLTINGYTEGSSGGYYLIASPVTVDPATVGGMTEGDFDLYYYDQAQDREWINYKVGDDGTGGPFNLIPGNGYLYAKKATPETTTYNFPLMGTPYSGNGQVFLHKSDENENMSGWNLVGNPFAQTAYIDRDFYVMKDNGEEIITANRENNEVNRMEGIFVIATNDNEPLTFSTTPIANSGSKLVLNLSQGRGIVDRAIVRFGEGRTLPKFMLNNENTKLYIPQEGNDYAVVYAEDQGELPLNFKAAEDGTYTLSFSNENTEFSSLHLIDNMSRADIDLLANPSYTFDAQATDEETRFTLVYEKAGSTLTIGTGWLYSGSGNQEPTATDYGAGSPMGNTYFTYSTAQFIYTAEEMGGAKTINSLAFKHNNLGSFIGTVKIYLVHTSNSEVHVNNPATTGTLVYTGTNITLGSNSNEWQTFNLDIPFEYDGSHNLLVVVCRTKATSGTPNYNNDQGWQYTSYSGHYRYMVRSKSNSTYGDITNTEHYVRGFKRPNIRFGYTAPVVNHFDLNIKGWTSNNNNYYLIASPIGQVNPSDVTNMLSNSYDLFYFDQAGDDQGYEWITYKAGAGATDPGFNLVPGKGYLYANSGVATNNPNIVTLTFTGSAFTGSGQVNLVYTEDNPVPYMRGWNLVGNPFGVDAYIDRSYYAMNSDGTEIEPHSGVIAPMQGLFVHVNQNETMTFTTTPPSKGSSLSLNVSKGRGIIDRAILNFSEGRQLPKFQLNPNHTKVYMPVEGNDYAVVSAEEQGEMPVSFKAEENGTYTFSFDPENVEFDYLHLVDNLTGANVDLLSTPSYSFEAKTTDYESRFKLVFATICDDADGDSETFAFYSNGSFVINNEGVATLQVIDVMGRIISSESINGSANVNINAADGVYMLRLINGERVKTQKVVVK